MPKQIKAEDFTVVSTNTPDVAYMAQVAQMLVTQPNLDDEKSN